jgi:hypothetical protein
MKKINENQEFKKIGNGDFICLYNSKWPIYKLDTLNKKGIWNKIQNIFINLQTNDKFDPLTPEQIDKFFLKRPEIDFEVDYFSDVMRKCLVFKYKNKVYCYTFGTTKRKNGRKILVRFYFDYVKFLKEFDNI